MNIKKHGPTGPKREEATPARSGPNNEEQLSPSSNYPNIDLDILAARYRKHLRRTPRAAVSPQFEQLRLGFIDCWNKADAVKLSAATADMRTAVAQEFDFIAEEERVYATRLAKLERTMGLWMTLNVRPRKPMSAATKRRLQFDRFIKGLEKQWAKERIMRSRPLDLWEARP